jgi:glycosyltransferase involved in cell wall biosynthesis
VSEVVPFPDGEHPIVTIAIPTLNRPHTCMRSIESALNQIERCQIVVSENCSDADFSARYDALFDALPKNIRVVRRSGRLLVEDHFRSLAALVDTPYMIFLADDDILMPDFVSRALPFAQQNSHVAVFGPYKAEWSATGRVEVRSFDYSSKVKFVRMLKFVCRRNDTFVYGLFSTHILNKGLRELVPLNILGRRTVTRITYPPLFSCLLDGSYGHLSGEPVWVSTVDSNKNESYLGKNNVMKLVYLVLGEGILARRFIRIAARNEGPAFAALLAPFVCAMGVVEAIGFVALAARRTAAMVLGGLGGRGIG